MLPLPWTHCTSSSRVNSGCLQFLTSKEKCPKTGAVVITPASQRRGWWASYGAREYPFLADAALRLLSVHPTACAAERNWSVWGQVYTKLRSRLSLKLAQDIVFIRGNRAANVSGQEELVMLQMLEEEAADQEAAEAEMEAAEAVEEANEEAPAGMEG